MYDTILNEAKKREHIRLITGRSDGRTYQAIDRLESDGLVNTIRFFGSVNITITPLGRDTKQDRGNQSIRPETLADMLDETKSGKPQPTFREFDHDGTKAATIFLGTEKVGGIIQTVKGNWAVVWYSCDRFEHVPNQPSFNEALVFAWAVMVDPPEDGAPERGVCDAMIENGQPVTFYGDTGTRAY